MTASAPPSGQFSLGFSFAAEESAVATAAKNGQPRKKKGTDRNYHESHESVKIKFSFCPAGKVSVQVPVTGFGSVGTFSSGGSRRFPQNPPSRVALGRNKRNFSQSATADLAHGFLLSFLLLFSTHARKRQERAPLREWPHRRCARERLRAILSFSSPTELAAVENVGRPGDSGRG